jgi:hypothetical protein
MLAPKFRSFLYKTTDDSKSCQVLPTSLFSSSENVATLRAVPQHCTETPKPTTTLLERCEIRLLWSQNLAQNHHPLNPLSEPNPKATATQGQGIWFFGKISPNGQFVFETVRNLLFFEFLISEFRNKFFLIARFYPKLQQVANNIEGC